MQPIRESLGVGYPTKILINISYQLSISIYTGQNIRFILWDIIRQVISFN